MAIGAVSRLANTRVRRPAVAARMDETPRPHGPAVSCLFGWPASRPHQGASPVRVCAEQELAVFSVTVAPDPGFFAAGIVRQASIGRRA